MSEKMLWEVGKEYKTLGGKRARIYATDGVGDNHIHGAYFREEVNRWSAAQWDNEGKMGYSPGCVLNLLPPAKPRIKGECWLVIDEYGGIPFVRISKESASHLASKYEAFSILHVPYDVEEGEGL